MWKGGFVRGSYFGQEEIAGDTRESLGKPNRYEIAVYDGLDDGGQPQVAPKIILESMMQCY
jgi:hypothetical protein